MRNIHYFKYASNGNNFILIDELKHTQIPETQKATFSKYIGNEATGMGCDSLIFLQNDTQYQHHSKPHYIMRIYENGLESNMCGNGLICLAHHLLRRHAIKNAVIGTEMPSQRLVSREVVAIDSHLFKAKLGKACLPKADFINAAIINHATENKLAYRLKDIPVSFHLNNTQYTTTFEHCYMTFTGEPHIVIFKPAHFDLNDSLQQRIFEILFREPVSKLGLQQSQSLIHQLARQFNQQAYFPKEVNINFAEILPDGKIANRCYERGINHETYACGTGATAVAVLAHELKLLNSSDISILPWRARFEPFYKNAEILLNRNDDIYYLSSESIFLSKGEYAYSDRMS